jgi:fatty acid desaturase
MPQPDDTFSPRAMRITLIVIALAMVLLAFTVSDVFSWLWWLTMAIAVIAGCAAITPPFRRPRP